MCSLSEYSSHIKNKVDFYCTEDNEMSVYILHLLDNNIFHLFEYMEKVIDFDNMKFEDFNTFKEIIYLIGKDVKKIIKTAINTIVNEYFTNKKKLKGPQVIHAALINEQKNFEELIGNPYKIKFTSNIIKWVNEPLDYYTIEYEKFNFDEDNKINENLKNDIYK